LTSINACGIASCSLYEHGCKDLRKPLAREGEDVIAGEFVGRILEFRVTGPGETKEVCNV